VLDGLCLICQQAIRKRLEERRLLKLRKQQQQQQQQPGETQQEQKRQQPYEAREIPCATFVDVANPTEPVLSSADGTHEHQNVNPAEDGHTNSGHKHQLQRHHKGEHHDIDEDHCDHKSGQHRRGAAHCAHGDGSSTDILRLRGCQCFFPCSLVHIGDLLQTMRLSTPISRRKRKIRRKGISRTKSTDTKKRYQKLRR